MHFSAAVTIVYAFETIWQWGKESVYVARKELILLTELLYFTQMDLSGNKRDGSSTSGGSNVPLYNNEGGVGNFPRKKKVLRKKLKKAMKVEKNDLVQTSSSTMMVKIHGSNVSSSEHVEKS